jgi:hypothetical protein
MVSKAFVSGNGIEVSDRHINRLLRNMGLSTRQKSQPSDQVAAPSTNANIAIKDLASSSPPNLLWSISLNKTSY